MTGTAALSDSVNLVELDRIDAGTRAALMVRAEADLSTYLGPAQEIIEALRDEGDAAVVRCNLWITVPMGISGRVRRENCWGLRARPQEGGW